MEQLLAVLTSDEISRYWTRFTVGALEDMLERSWESGVPSFVSHDYHLPLAWSISLGIHLEPGIARLTGLYLLPKNAQDQERINQSIKYDFSKRISEVAGPHIPELERRLKPYLTGDEAIIMPSCAALYGKGLAQRAFAQTFEAKDKDGLIPLSSLRLIAPGVFENDGLILFAHSFFRRSLSRFNSLSGPFFAIMRKLSERNDLDIRVALDEDMVGLASTIQENVEFQYWWGPKFSDDLSNIKMGVATRHESDERQRFFHGISRTEFWWYVQDDRPTFECEEVRDTESLGISKDKFGCRYVHSILDPANSTPVHLDGAIRMYTTESMLERLAKDIIHAGRNSDYTKLWRVDGNLEVDVWKELITHYFRDNQLIGEYFGGRETEQVIQPAEPLAESVDPILQYVPTTMDVGQGVRISVSYHPLNKTDAPPRHIRVFGSLLYDSVTYNYIEADAIYVFKMLLRMGEEIVLPSEAIHVQFKDNLINVPLIMHRGPDALVLAEKTQRAIAEVCELWVSLRADKLFSYTIGVQYPDRDVYFSVAGHVADVHTWLQREESAIPQEATVLKRWIERAYETISRDTSPANDVPLLATMLQHSGMLQFRRVPVDRKYFGQAESVNFQSEAVPVVIPKDEAELYEAVSSGALKIAPVLWLRDYTCAACRTAFAFCSCLPCIEQEAVRCINDVVPISFTWTNRKKQC